MEKRLDAYKLKLIAVLFMIVDHVYSYLNTPVHAAGSGTTWPMWIPVITRFVSPLFLYLMVEGFYHTRSRKKYLSRLLVAAAIMWCGNIVINYLFHNVSSSTGRYSFASLIQGHNIFLTLADMFVFIWCLENIRQRKHMVLSIFFAVITAVLSILLEGGFYLLPIAFFAWLFYGKKSLQCIGIGVWCIALLVHTLMTFFKGGTEVTLYNYVCFDNEWANLLVIPFILLYNGERGKNTLFTKYMFYTVYPIHIWILMIIRFVIEK